MAGGAQPTPFPRQLLHQALQARLDYFKGYTIAHPALKQADQAVWNALREPAGACLIFVVGPTGVGKTTLLAQIEKRLIDFSLAQAHVATVISRHSGSMRCLLHSTSSSGAITIKERYCSWKSHSSSTPLTITSTFQL